jgi:hypothetical protein
VNGQGKSVVVMMKGPLDAGTSSQATRWVIRLKNARADESDENL